MRKWRARRSLFAAMIAFSLLAGSAPAPPDPFCVVYITPFEGFQFVVIAVDLILNESELLVYFEAVDADNDSSVSLQETSEYENASSRIIRWQTFDEFNRLGELKLLIDDTMPEEIHILTDLKSFEGPVDPARKVAVTEVRSYPFPPGPGPGVGGPLSHKLEGGEDAQWRPKPAVETGIISAPPGWWVWSVNGTIHREKVVTVPGFDYKSHFTIVYAQEGLGPDGHAVGWLQQIAVYTVAAIVIIAVIGATVFVLSRRKESRSLLAKVGDTEGPASVEPATGGRKD